jgi:tetratricopeptide (TPR) repeat protein
MRNIYRHSLTDCEAEAYNINEQIIESINSLSLEDSPTMIKMLMDLAEAYSWFSDNLSEKGKTYLNKVEETYLQALKMHKRINSEDQYEHSRILYWLGHNYGHKCDFRKAEKYLSEAIEIGKMLLGEDHVYVANMITLMHSDSLRQSISAEQIYQQGETSKDLWARVRARESKT